MRLARLFSLFAIGALALSISISIASSPAAAQPKQAVGGIGILGVKPDEGRGAQASPLKEMFGVPVAAKLIQSDDPADRIRGIERLGGIGTTEAIDALVEQIEQGSP